jgi:hypothetical protein
MEAWLIASIVVWPLAVVPIGLALRRSARIELKPIQDDSEPDPRDQWLRDNAKRYNDFDREV